MLVNITEFELSSFCNITDDDMQRYIEHFNNRPQNIEMFDKS